MPPQAFLKNIVAFRSLVLLLCVFSAQNAWACYKAPEQQLIGVDEQITSFVVGGRYLMFLGSPFTRRSAEKIEAVDWPITSTDTWLAYVKAGLGKRKYPETLGRASTAQH